MDDIHPFLIAQLLMLLASANGAPLIAKKVFGTALAFPLDNGVRLADGQPLLGRSKTIRGIGLSLAVTTLGAPWAGLSPAAGLLVSAAAMIGDLFSSFIKRRMKLAPSSMALGIDQIPESLLPAIAARWALPVTVLDAAILAGLFFIGELAASRVLFALNIRDCPY
jgi:CDP-2,3-bis-(O-geranylgeranyl)-sn-glycerol synthase